MRTDPVGDPASFRSAIENCPDPPKNFFYPSGQIGTFLDISGHARTNFLNASDSQPMALVTNPVTVHYCTERRAALSCFRHLLDRRLAPFRSRRATWPRSDVGHFAEDTFSFCCIRVTNPRRASSPDRPVLRRAGKGKRVLGFILDFLAVYRPVNRQSARGLEQSPALNGDPKH